MKVGRRGGGGGVREERREERVRAIGSMLVCVCKKIKCSEA